MACRLMNTFELFNNRRFREAFTSDAMFDKLAEGVATLKALRLLSSRHDIELPIRDFKNNENAS